MTKPYLGQIGRGRLLRAPYFLGAALFLRSHPFLRAALALPLEILFESAARARARGLESGAQWFCALKILLHF